MNRIRFPVFDLSYEVLDHFINVFSKNKFDFVYGYTNSLMRFSEHLKKSSLVLKQLCPSIKCCITTSETLFEKNRTFLNLVGRTVLARRIQRWHSQPLDRPRSKVTAILRFR